MDDFLFAVPKPSNLPPRRKPQRSLFSSGANASTRLPIVHEDVLASKFCNESAINPLPSSSGVKENSIFGINPSNNFPKPRQSSLLSSLNSFESRHVPAYTNLQNSSTRGLGSNLDVASHRNNSIFNNPQSSNDHILSQRMNRFEQPSRRTSNFLEQPSTSEDSSRSNFSSYGQFNNDRQSFHRTAPPLRNLFESSSLRNSLMPLRDNSITRPHLLNSNYEQPNQSLFNRRNMTNSLCTSQLIPNNMEQIRDSSLFSGTNRNTSVMSSTGNISTYPQTVVRDFEDYDEICRRLQNGQLSAEEGSRIIKEIHLRSFMRQEATLQNLTSSNKSSLDVLARANPEAVQKVKYQTTQVKVISSSVNKIANNKTEVVKRTDYLIIRRWVPVANDKDLIFKGVLTNGRTIETAPVKKRVDNRSVQLMDGTICKLEGSPVLDGLPETIAGKLKNGLTARWRVFQESLKSNNRSKAFLRNSTSPKKKISTTKPKTTKVIIESTPVKSKQRVIKDISAIAIEKTPLTVFRHFEKNRQRKSPVKSNNIKTPPKAKKSAKEKIEQKIQKVEKNPVVKNTPRKKVDETSESAQVLKKITNISPILTNQGRKRKTPLLKTRLQQSLLKTSTPIQRIGSKRGAEDTEEKSLKKQKTETPSKQVRTKHGRIIKRKIYLEDSLAYSDSLKNIETKNKNKKKTRADVPKKTTSKPKENISPKKKRLKTMKEIVTPKLTKKPLKSKNTSICSNTVNVAGESPWAAGNSFMDNSQIGIDIRCPETIRKTRGESTNRSIQTGSETPPLQDFQLEFVSSVTPNISLKWKPSQRSSSEGRNFENNRVKAFKKTKKVVNRKIKKTLAPKNKKKSDLKLSDALNWIAKAEQKKNKKNYDEEEEDEDAEEEDGDLSESGSE